MILLEMKETAFICNSTTDRSLFLLDELGRATSNEDGVAIALAVSEYLLTKRDMVSDYMHWLLRSSFQVPLFFDAFLQRHISSRITPNLQSWRRCIQTFKISILDPKLYLLLQIQTQVSPTIHTRSCLAHANQQATTASKCSDCSCLEILPALPTLLARQVSYLISSFPFYS